MLSRADEGMWMLNRIDEKTAEAMQSLGLELTPDQLYSTEHASLKDCVVDFGDFCSGVVVSKDWSSRIITAATVPSRSFRHLKTTF